LRASGERVIKIDDDRQEREQAENDEIRGNEHPADPWHAERVLQRAHR
jgi:hypothetical protein